MYLAYNTLRPTNLSPCMHRVELLIFPLTREFHDLLLLLDDDPFLRRQGILPLDCHVCSKQYHDCQRSVGMQTECLQ